MREPITSKTDTLVDALAQRIADYAYDNGFKKLVWIPIGLVTFLGAFGITAKSDGLRFTTIVIGYVTLCLVILILLLDRRVRRRENRRKSILLNKYMDRVYLEQAESRDLFEYLEWDEEVFIAPDGSAEIFRWCTIQVGTRAIPAIWSKCIQTDSQDDNSHRKEPIVKCASFHETPSSESATANKEVGARLLVTHHWRGRGEQIAYAHFDEPLEPGEVIRVVFHFSWPQFSEHLFEQGFEQMYWKFGKMVHAFRATLTFDARCQTEKFRISPFGTDKSVNAKRRPNGEFTIWYDTFRPVRGHKFGFRVDTGLH